MGAELGATTSIFPSDDVTRAFLRAQGREEDFQPLEPDADAVYDGTSIWPSLRPLAARPFNPDNVATVRRIGPIAIDQVAIGSCTSSSLMDMLKVAAILKGRSVHPDVSLVIAPGSAGSEYAGRPRRLVDMIAAGALDFGIGLRALHRYGPSAANQRGFAPEQQQKFYGRSGGVGRCLSGRAGGRRRQRLDRCSDRSANLGPGSANFVARRI